MALSQLAVAIFSKASRACSAESGLALGAEVWLDIGAGAHDAKISAPKIANTEALIILKRRKASLSIH
jgi:hypothetical protein